MLEGTIAGADAALEMGKGESREEEVIKDSMEKLNELRAGPYYEDLRAGLTEVEK